MSFLKEIIKSNYSREISVIKKLGISLPIALISFCVTGCVDDKLIMDKDSEIQSGEPVFEGDAIAFSVQLDKEMNTRANSADAYDNYIDTRHKFRVLFFKENGDFLFGATDRTVTELPTSGDKCNWYVRVPVNYLEDKNKREYPVEQIKEYLKTNPFKVAILANWPNQDKNGEPDDKFPEPNWNVENSFYYEQKESTDPIPDLKNINDLHHLYRDTYYWEYISNREHNSGRPSSREVYDFVMIKDDKDGDYGKLGINTDWVKMRDINEPGAWKLTSTLPQGSFDTKESAETWIRANWNPEVAKTKKIYREYEDLWLLWDFNASYNSKEEVKDNRGNVTTRASYPFNTWGNDKFGQQWYNRNGNLIKSWINEYHGYNGNYEYNNSITANNEKDGLTFIANTNRLCWFARNGSNMGIGLRMAENTDVTNDNKHYINPEKSNGGSRGYLKFMAPATGTLRIKCGSYKGTSKLVVQRSTNRDKVFDISGATPQDIIVTNADQTTTPYRDMSLTGGPEPIYIWNEGPSNGGGVSDDDSAIIIYSIEWICSKYLYDTDREGVLPSEDHPIPMYGVQQFVIPENAWEDGTTYDISAPKDGNIENTIYISLIRSLAKVVVNLTQKPEHIYMRSMNRKARVEPIDVESSTGSLWKKHERNAEGGHCEWFDIYNYGVGFRSGDEPSNNNNDRMKYLDEYTDWLSWFYGSWSAWNFDFKSHNDYFFNTQTVTVPTSPSPPHLFNSDIQRSDYCHFIYDGQNKGYFRYILYVPDKNISDPNYPGMMESIAKLPSIEYRYSGMTQYLDDNNCHRIYFTDYDGKTTGTKNTAITNVKANQYESSYEKSKDNLNKHWPIMRNHAYIFNVGGSGTFKQTFQVKVADWGYQPVDVEW